jgi:hypothetical protein
MTFDLPNESCAGQREEVPDKGYSTLDTSATADAYKLVPSVDRVEASRESRSGSSSNTSRKSGLHPMEPGVCVSVPAHHNGHFAVILARCFVAAIVVFLLIHKHTNETTTNYTLSIQ